MNCTIMPELETCFHQKCVLARGEMTREEYLENRASWHFDTNWGRFLPEDKRKKYHDLLVQDALKRGLEDIDIMGAVYLGIWGQ